MKSPFISVITYGRNDAYAPSYAKKVGRATNLLARQLEGAGIDSEILLVEWNPAPGRPGLFDMFETRDRLHHVGIRRFTIDGEHHKRFLGAEEGGFHVVEAANAGIRRARGRFVVPKSSDTFFSPALIERLARLDLDPSTVYRANRHDIPVADESWDLDDSSLLACFESLPSSIHDVIVQPRQWALRDLHTNACGDFMLMSSEQWHRLRGFPFYSSVLTLDADSLALHAAAAIGVRECRWPDDCRIYKPLHGNLSGSRVSQIWPEWQRALDKFLSEKVSEKAALRARIIFDYPRRKVRGIDSIDGPSIERNFVWVARRWNAGAPFQPTQPENWGLRDVALEERALCRADWELGSP
ncbi:MAG: hypothetical protein KIS73_09375 [Enhydrobacter sp.]|nr:hypothetical protein [Enhydrobacter sp.]